MNDRFPIDSDAPIDDPDRDRLGFGGPARHLADVFLHNDLSDPLVVGISKRSFVGRDTVNKARMTGAKDQVPRRIHSAVVDVSIETFHEFIQDGKIIWPLLIDGISPPAYQDIETIVVISRIHLSILPKESAREP